jgi:hypothetical protein
MQALETVVAELFAGVDEAVHDAPVVALVAPHDLHDHRGVGREEFSPCGAGVWRRQAVKEALDRLVAHPRAASRWLVCRIGILFDFAPPGMLAGPRCHLPNPPGRVYWNRGAQGMSGGYRVWTRSNLPPAAGVDPTE